MSKIAPFLWFDLNAEEAVNFYLSVFKNAKIHAVHRNPGTLPGPKGSVVTIDFELDGQQFVALNGGPKFKFTEAISFFVQCKDQAEIDYYWEKLTSDGGKPVQCGWLKDKYGLFWQIVPEDIGELVANPAAMKAMMQMIKLDIAAMRNAK
ncbi:MAG TPA: VOC family protein [Tepidisphaeraceae bacterium]|jgi:predicted 3-demethylubiquinone-9 3-methyltransferase (glyoxalase superfamily)